MTALLAAAVDELTLADIGWTLAFVSLVIVTLVAVTHRWPRDDDDPRWVSMRAMRKLCQRVDRERIEHPERQS